MVSGTSIRSLRATLAAAFMYGLWLLASAEPVRAGVNVWTSHGPGGGNVRALAIDPKAPATLYAATWSGGVFKSTDAGGNWEAASAGLPPEARFGALAIDPKTGATLYAGTSLGVFKSADAGRSWRTTSLAGVFANALGIDPANTATVYAGIDAGGVMKNTDGGNTWNAVNTGLTSTSILALAIVPTTPTTLYAGTRVRCGRLGGVRGRWRVREH
jgi:photosystem II stability/assembly factor-like uncharacterized protein